MCSQLWPCQASFALEKLLAFWEQHNHEDEDLDLSKKLALQAERTLTIGGFMRALETESAKVKLRKLAVIAVALKGRAS
eukprot:2508317-Amphidinium_carterae.1